jgi:hypothetical protein
MTKLPRRALRRELGQLRHRASAAPQVDSECAASAFSHLENSAGCAIKNLAQGYVRMIPRHQKLREEFRQVSAAKQMAFDPRRGRGSDSRSPIKKLAAGSTGQHHNRSVIIPGAALRQSLTDIRRTTFDPSFVLILLASPSGFEPLPAQSQR